MLFVSKNCSLEKVAFMNSSCFIICELNWIVFMAIVKHFRVKMRLAFFCCANLIKYKDVSRYPAAGKCFQKTTYPAVRNFGQFSPNSSFNSSKNIRYLFRNLKRL